MPALTIESARAEYKTLLQMKASLGFLSDDSYARMQYLLARIRDYDFHASRARWNTRCKAAEAAYLASRTPAPTP